MRANIRYFVLVIALSVASCKKDTNKVSPQTILLLQNKWALISSNTVFPTNTSLNATYKGVATDYYEFASNDSLTIKQVGQLNLPTIPISLTTKYLFIDNNRLTYGLTPNVEINIKALTNNLLVLTNDAKVTFTNNGVVVATYEGTKTDSLRR